MVTYFTNANEAQECMKRILFRGRSIIKSMELFGIFFILISLESRMQAPIHQQVQLEPKPSHGYLLTFELASLRLIQ